MSRSLNWGDKRLPVVQGIGRTDLGHGGGLMGEYPKQFLEEVIAAYENSLKNKY